jgi:hypothetical protein
VSETIENPTPYVEDEEENDEFEKFVGRFSKGPVPGEENKNDNKAE